MHQRSYEKVKFTLACVCSRGRVGMLGPRSLLGVGGYVQGRGMGMSGGSWNTKG